MTRLKYQQHVLVVSKESWCMRSFEISQEVDSRGVEQVVRAIKVILESRIIKMLNVNFSRLGF
jgi:hypothetical protein